MPRSLTLIVYLLLWHSGDSVLSDVRPDIQWGEDVERIMALATTNADRLIRKLLVESIASWVASQFDRYDDREISFTVAS